MKIKTWHIIGTVFTVVAGSLLHFIYEWSGFYPLFALIGSVNESVWEHLKLLYWPFVMMLIAELWIYGKNVSGFFASKALGILAGMAFITAVFYTYSGIVGQSFVIVDILLFVAGAAIAFSTSYKYIKCSFKNPKRADLAGMTLFLVLAVMLCMYTFNPPQLGIFCFAN